MTEKSRIDVCIFILFNLMMGCTTIVFVVLAILLNGNSFQWELYQWETILFCASVWILFNYAFIHKGKSRDEKEFEKIRKQESTELKRATEVTKQIENRRKQEFEHILTQPAAKDELRKQHAIRDRVDLFLTILETRQVHLPLVSRILNIDGNNLRRILEESGLDCRFSRNGQVVAFRPQSAEEFIKVLGNSYETWVRSDRETGGTGDNGESEAVHNDEEALKLSILSDVFRAMFAGENRLLVNPIARLLDLDPAILTQIVEDATDSHGFRVIGENLATKGVEVEDFVDRVIGHIGARDREQFEDEIDSDFSRWARRGQKEKRQDD
jgi:hypothetical protein